MGWFEDIVEDVWEGVTEAFEYTTIGWMDDFIYEPLSDVTQGSVDFRLSEFGEGLGQSLLNIVNPPDIPDFRAPTPGSPEAPIAAARLKRRKSSSANMFGANSPFVIQPPSGGGVNVPGN